MLQLINGVLKSARSSKSNGCVVILDLAKAFDTIRNKHIQLTLNSLPIPNNLRCLLQNLTISNTITIKVNKKHSKMTFLFMD